MTKNYIVHNYSVIRCSCRATKTMFLSMYGVFDSVVDVRLCDVKWPIYYYYYYYYGYYYYYLLIEQATVASYTKYKILRGQNPILFPYKNCPEISARNFHSLKGNNTEAGRALKLFCATAVQHLQMCVCVC